MNTGSVTVCSCCGNQQEHSEGSTLVQCGDCGFSNLDGIENGGDWS